MLTQNKKIDLLLLCELFYPQLTTGQTLTELCEELAQKGVNIEVLCAQPPIIGGNDKVGKIDRIIEYKNIIIKRVWSTRFSKNNLFGRIINQVTYTLAVFFELLFNKAKRPILVVTNPPFLAIICAIFRKFGGNPYIYLVFDVYPETAINLGILKKNSYIVKIWRWFNKLSFKYASEIIVIGRCMKKIISNQMPEEYEKKINTIHIWSNDKLIKPISKENNPFMSKWNLANKFVLIYSGNMGRFHDMETIMEAAKILNDNYNILFLFVGEGYKKKYIMKYADNWKLKNCQFHTFVAKENLGYLLSCADVGLVSLCEGQEGLSVPSKTFGIMAAGVPVIGIISNNSEIARIIDEEKCGFVVQPGNTNELVSIILNLYNNRNVLNCMSLRAREIIDNKYNLNHAANQYYDLIRKHQN